MRKLIATIDCTPKLKAYWRCQLTDFNGDQKLINLEKGNRAAQNLLTLGYKYKSVTFEEYYINENEYESINFSDFI